MTEASPQKIGLAMSGGGVRATTFHLGMLLRLARSKHLDSVSFISTVSGGSLAVALVLAQSSWKWPRSEEFEASTLVRCRQLLTTKDLQRSYIVASLLKPWVLFRGRAAVLGSVLHRLWGVNATLNQLPPTPRWIINATTFETGKGWIFSAKRMGDYVAGYVLEPKFSIAEAAGASAGFPIGIGPLTLEASAHEWHEFDGPGSTPKKCDPKFSRMTIWDGGVYDNLGVEPLWKPGQGLREGADFLLVSDASKALSNCGYRRRDAPLRLVEIAQDQVRSVRARELVRFFAAQPGSGAYVRIGNASAKIYQQAKATLPKGETLSTEDAQAAGAFPTTLRRLTEPEFDLLVRHGYESADATLGAYRGGTFPPIPYKE